MTASEIERELVELEKQEKGLRKKLHFLILGLSVEIIGYILMWIYYGWKLCVIIFLIEFSRNSYNKYQE